MTAITPGRTRATGDQHPVQDALARDEGTNLTGVVVGSGAMWDVLFGLLFPAGSACASGRSQHPGRMAP